MKNGKVRQNRKKNSVYKKQKNKRNNAMKKWKLYPIKGDKIKHKISRKPTIKKKRIKSKSKLISDKIIRKKNEQPPKLTSREKTLCKSGGKADYQSHSRL